ncbi:SDR family NAD(P)-dependent oxidoreductase [Streptomyces sp. 184]|uniref:type I polyketide synthase n=1 Tax=Streptomyces sp. 184 TaxID=1827526 RepID=UPI003892776B
MSTPHGEPIAVVGIGLRFPGGNTTPDGFAAFLRDGRSGLRPLPTDRWDPVDAGDDDPGAPGGIRCAQGGFIDKVDHFDAKFFNISPKEADFVDPQHRVALEVAWEALEDAGVDPTPLRHGTGGVYMAVSNLDYAGEMGAYSLEELNPHMATGVTLSALAGRLSYFLGWRGPCMTVDTACSASLVTVHLAAQALRAGETDLALCGGVNTIHSPRAYVMAGNGNMLAPDGVCKTFDDAADGYSRSEGCGVVVLKRLSDAQRDGDRIYALVRGSAVGQDGESSSLMVPNGTAQERLIRAALAGAGLEPGDISYAEAHGTGTPLGDPIEMGAIGAVFGASHTREDPLAVASLKTNIGHMESAAGIGGIIKTVLQLRDGALYPHLNLDTPSRRIPWDDLPVTVPTSGRPWTADTRRAVVSSFGLTGIIGSVVLEEAPAPTAAAPPPAPRPADPEGPGEAHVLTLSARSAGALRGQVQRYQRMLRDRPGTDVAELCHAAATTRAHFDLRTAGVVRDHDDVARLLDNALTRSTRPGRPAGPARTAFLFSGGGTQYVGMGRPLYERFDAFREHLDACDRLFAPHLGRSIRDMVLGDADDAELIHQIRYMQPALFALEYAVAGLWLSWGVRPSVLAGHSIGEIVAATVAGLFSLDDAVTLMAARARLMDASPPGAMAAAEASPAEAADLLEEHDDLSVAAVNGARQIVLSGGKASLASVEEALAGRGVRTRRLAVSCASHSPLMAEAAAELREVAAGLTFHTPEFTLVSNVTGRIADPAELSTPDYWARHLREPVRFAEGIRAVAERGPHAFLEVGPATELVGMGKQVLDAPGDHQWLSSLHAEDTDATVARQSLAQLYAAGAPVSWAGYYGDRPRSRLTLPTYAFDRRRHWLPAPSGAAAARGSGDVHPLLGREVSTDEQRAAGVRTFSARLDARRPAYLADHKVMGRVVFPGAGYVETLLALQDAVYGETTLPVTGVTIHEALLVPDEGSVELRTRLRPGAGDLAEVEIVSLVASEDPGAEPFERRHLTATVDAAGPAGAAGAALTETQRSLHDLLGRADEPRSQRQADDLYADFAELGVEYGPHFRGVRRVERHGDHLAVGELRGRDAAPVEHLPPAVLDCALQTITALADDSETVAMPVGFGRCRLLRKPRGETLRSVLRVTPPAAGADGELPTADVLVLDGDRPVFVLEGLTLRRVANAAPDRDRMYSEVRWVKRSLRTTAAEPRHVLLVGPARAGLDDLAGPAKERGVTLSVAATSAEAVALLKERPTDVCWFWRPPENDGEPLPAECERNYRDLLALRDALEQTGFGQGQRLWLVTEGGQAVPGDRPQGADGVGQAPPAAATLWGFGHVMWTEYPAYGLTLVDLPPPAGDAAGTGYPVLLEEMAAKESGEYQVAYRSGLRHVRRVHPKPGGPRTDVELVIKEYGQVGGVVAVPLGEEPAPEGSRIRVRVHAAGLNVKDVLNVLGLHRVLAEEAGTAPPELPLGLECAGVVTAAGPRASFRVGDAVVAAHVGSLRREVTVESAMAAPKPARLGFAEAAALPVAFLTAYHGLHHLAGVRRGDKVLIHAAAGGVGQAAVRLAQRAGAEVFATASPHKWPLLRAQGVRHLMNSRALTYDDEVLAATDGAGVDIVLHSLGGDRVEHSLRALGRDGRFVELGKIGAWSPEDVHRARPDVTYHTFDFGEFTAEQSQELASEVLGPVMELVGSGELTPLPTTAYTLDEVDEAFGVLQRGANVGKAVVTFGGDPDAEPPPAARPVEVGPDHTYLVTGGFGALGRLAAERLAALGARHLALTGRNTPAAGELDALRAHLGPDVEVVAYAADVGDAADVERVFADLRTRPWPLGGIVHAAGVLADAPVAAQTWESIETIFRAKVYGSWLLHRNSLADPDLRFFLGYSSVTSVLGTGGQANYAAGNAFLDTLMCRRHAAGLPGTSVNWGAWGEIGLAAGMDAQYVANVERQGFTFFRPVTGMRALFRLLDRPPAQVTIAEVDWDRCAATRPQPNALYHHVGRGPARRTADVDLAALAALPPAERREAVSRTLRGLIADLLHHDGPDDVPPDARFFEVGLDSLAAVELKNALQQCFRLPLSAASVFDHPSVSLLAEFIDGQLAAPAGPGTAADPVSADRADGADSTNGDTR